MSTLPPTITLPTRDHGPVTIPEPSWCVGHADHRPDTYRADLSHDGPTLSLTFCGQPIGHAVISQAPCAELGTRDVLASVVLDFEGVPGGFTPAGLYDFAAALDSSADRFRDLADELAEILAGGEDR